MKKLFCFAAFLLCVCTLHAQKMEFTFSNLSGVKSEYLHDGTTLVQLPATASFANMSSYGMTVKADGANATLSDIVPNPATKTDYVDGALNVFYYKGKAYKVRFAIGEYFTAVFFSDAKLGSASSLSKADLAAFTDRITKMGTVNGPLYEFNALPGYTPTADIAFYLGDMNATTSQTPIIHTLGNDYMNIVAKCAIVAGQIESTGTSSTITEYGLCLGTAANPTTSNTYKAASDLGGTDDTFNDVFSNVFGVYFDDLTAQTTYHVRAYCKYTVSGSNTVYTTYGEDREITTPGLSGFTWAWEGGDTPDDAARARIIEAMDGASYYYNNYCTLYKWCGTCYNAGVQTADCSLRSDGSCYIRFGPGERYQWVGTAQHEISHGYGVGQTGAYAGYANPFQFRVATLTLRVFLRDMSMRIYHDGMHYWPGGINQREEVTNGTSNDKGTYTCRNEEMLKCNAMILNGLAKDGMQTWYGWAKDRNGFDPAVQEQQGGGGPNKVSQAQNASASDFEDALDAFNQAGIPLILTPGDLDLAATANSAGKTLNTNTFAAITRSVTEAQTHGIENLQRFTNGQSTTTQIQAQPFTFTFKGVRFYNGQRTWFDEPMYNSGSTYRWIVPDAIYSNLQTFVNSHTSETSIWMQHIPMNAADADWYTSKTTYNASNTSRTATSSYNSAAKRRSALATLINSTANHALFSGHAGTYNDNYYNNQFHDYTVNGFNNTPGDVLIVLMKAGTGVVEVKRVDFRDYQYYYTQFDDPATEYTNGQNNATLAGLVKGLETLNTGDATINSAISTAKNVNTAANVSSSITSLNDAFVTYVQAQGDNVNVSGLLGENLDFETPIGAQNPNYANLFTIPGWNENMNVNSTTNAFLNYQIGQGSPNGGNTLYIRENWKTTPALPTTMQVYKDAVLPAGNYILQFEMRQSTNNATDLLNYCEINGVKTPFSASSSWETKSIPISVDGPTVIRLSFGFVGSLWDGNRPNQVDVDNIQLFYTQQVVTQGKASMELPWQLTTAKPDDYSKYFFTLWDHSQDLAMVFKDGVHQGNKTMWYAANVTPAFDKTSLWTFDSNVDGNTEYVVMTNVSYPDFMFQTEYNSPWNYRTNDNGAGDISWGRTIHAFSDNSWTVQNGKYPNDGYLGPWGGTIADNAEVALNKTEDAIGHFDIYRILRGEYVANFENLRSASVESPLNITYVLENTGAERRTDIGWKTNGAGWWTQGSTALNGKVGSYFMESWNGSGLAATDLYQEIYGLPDGTYRFSAIAHCTSNCIMYANAQETAMPTNNPGTRTSIVFNISGGEVLKVGFKTGTNPGSWIAFDDAKLEFLGAPDEYTVGAPQPSVTEGSYVQDLSVVTIAYPYASTSEAGETFALLNSNAKLALYKGNSKVAEKSLALNGRTLSADFSTFALETGTDYTFQLPADVVGYAGHVANEALTINFHTPAVWDGTYYLLNNSTNKYLSRGGAWATAAILDDWGLAMKLETDTDGKTTLKYFDSDAYVYNDELCWGDGANGLQFTVTKSDTYYKFLNQSNDKYFAASDGLTVANANDGAANVWTLESTSAHRANYTTCADAQSTTAATAASLSGITTKAALDAKVASDYEASDITITGATAERFQWYAATAETNTPSEYYKETLTGLTPGLYRLSVDAFQRAAWLEDVGNADGARGCIYVYANDAKTQLKSVMEYGSNTAYSYEGEDWADAVYNGVHYPNSEHAGYAALETGNYSNEVYVYVTDGNLTFGINNPNRLGNVNPNRGTWAVFDNFKLEYLEPYYILDETATTAPTAASNVKVKFKRTIVAKISADSGNAWNTICFPFDLSAQQVQDIFGEGTVVKALTSATPVGDSFSLGFTEVTDGIAANTPYIMQVLEGNGQGEYIIENININPSTDLTQTVGGVQFVGNYVYPCVMANTNGEDYYILNDVFKHSTGRTQIKGFRAYFHVLSSSGVKGLCFGDDDATGILEITDDMFTAPADIYSVGGQLLRKNATNMDDLPKGIYIVNGKKVLKSR